MRIIGLDLETTGLDVEKGHRIVEVAILTYDFDTRALVDNYTRRIDPERPIDAKAQEVHGISYSELVGQPKWEEVAPIAASRMAGAQFMICHNVGFDAPFVAAELLRVGIALPDITPYCTMENARWACADGKYPKLGELAFSLGVPYDLSKAHGADYDVQVMMECFWRGLDRGFYKLEVA